MLLASPCLGAVAITRRTVPPFGTVPILGDSGGFFFLEKKILLIGKKKKTEFAGGQEKTRERDDLEAPPCSGKGEITVRFTGVCKSAVSTRIRFGKSFL